MMRSQAARESMPEGDFRDWNAIEAWTDMIANTLEGRVPIASQTE
jgi:menaquinone-dependent protoporphyrinogen IX oxidase